MSPVAPFGSWDSPFAIDQVAAQRISRSSLASGGGALWWLEGRPQEGGRVVLVRCQDDAGPVVVSPKGTSIRSRVHEYGGGAWCLLADTGAFAYVEERSQRVFASELSGAPPVALSPEPPAGERWHHGGLSAGPAGTVLAVRERHHDGVVVRSVVMLGTDDPGATTTLCDGRDFFGSLALSPGGSRLAWVSWDHPNMPWDATELWVGELSGHGTLARPTRVGEDRLAGTSVDQPVWLDDDRLGFVSDVDGWWQPWLWREGDEPRRLDDREAEFQGPAWALGQHTMVALGPDELAFIVRHDGIDQLETRHIGSAPEVLEQPCVAMSALRAHEGGVAWLGQTPAAPGGVWRIARGSGSVATLVSGSAAPLSPDDVSAAQPISVPADGRLVHAHFYPPRLDGWRGPDGAAPPLIVQCHGGPTASADAGFDPVIQMLTTRGFAVAAVNYAGSTGYGRSYRQSLDGRWGEADIDDCVAVAAWLAESGRVDGQRMAIRGGSAGGLTALGALVRSRTFAAAVSWYGVSDLMGLVATTHDFESRYTDRLIGPLPEAAEAYRDRSPLNRVDEIEGAVLLLQGMDDPVVPADQTRHMAEALEQRGVRCVVRYFEGESHGFRRAETLVASFEAELGFYAEVLPGASRAR